MDVEPEPEVDVEGRVGQLFVVIGRQRVDLFVIAREEELSVFDGRQAEEDHIVRVDA